MCIRNVLHSSSRCEHATKPTHNPKTLRHKHAHFFHHAASSNQAEIKTHLSTQNIGPAVLSAKYICTHTQVSSVPVYNKQLLRWLLFGCFHSHYTLDCRVYTIQHSYAIRIGAARCCCGWCDAWSFLAASLACIYYTVHVLRKRIA